jgi:hypothetical protein
VTFRRRISGSGAALPSSLFFADEPKAAPARRLSLPPIHRLRATDLFLIDAPTRRAPSWEDWQPAMESGCVARTRTPAARSRLGRRRRRTPRGSSAARSKRPPAQAGARLRGRRLVVAPLSGALARRAARSARRRAPPRPSNARAATTTCPARACFSGLSAARVGRAARAAASARACSPRPPARQPPPWALPPSLPPLPPPQGAAAKSAPSSPPKGSPCRPRPRQAPSAVVGPLTRARASLPYGGSPPAAGGRRRPRLLSSPSARLPPPRPLLALPRRPPPLPQSCGAKTGHGLVFLGLAATSATPAVAATLLPPVSLATALARASKGGNKTLPKKIQNKCDTHKPSSPPLLLSIHTRVRRPFV